MEFVNTPQPWNNVGVKPTDELANEGFKAGYKPPAAYFNYLFNNYYNCLKELQESMAGGTTDTPKIKYIGKTFDLKDWQTSEQGVFFAVDTGEPDAQIGNVYFSPESLTIARKAGVKSVTTCTEGVVTIYADRMPEAALEATVEIVKEGW